MTEQQGSSAVLSERDLDPEAAQRGEELVALAAAVDRVIREFADDPVPNLMIPCPCCRQWVLPARVIEDQAKRLARLAHGLWHGEEDPS